MTTTADRIAHLEEQLRAADARLRRLEGASAAPREIPWAPMLPPRSGAGATANQPLLHAESGPSNGRFDPGAPAAAPKPTLEELLGGRVLAWVGGAAVLVGLALLFALGISNGWIGEGERCWLGAAGSALLLGLGVRLHERAGRTEAARAAVGTGLSGLFLSLTVATSGYELLPPALGVAGAAAVGTLAVALAIRWVSPAVAALGIVGALLAPVLAGQGAESGGLAFLAVATAAAVAVLVWQRWAWLSVCVALVVTPQWLGWLASERATGAIVLVLVTFGLLHTASALGTALRAPKVPALPAWLLLAGALLLAVVGWFALGEGTGGLLWLAGLAVTHAGLGLAVRRAPRLSTDPGLLLLAAAVLLADVAFALATDGVVRAFGWALGAVAFAALARQARAHDLTAVTAGLGLHVGLAILAAAQTVETGALLSGTTPDGAVLATFAALIGSCFLSGRLAGPQRVALDVTGLAAAALLAALALDGVALTALWAVQAAALCTRGATAERDPLAWAAGLVHLAAATLWCLVDQAAPTGLSEPVTALGDAALGLGVLLLATVHVARLARDEERNVLLGALAVGTLYSASLAVVALGVGDVRAGQLRLSGLWALVGTGALVAGLRADVAAVRVGALALLAVTIGKVFVYDLATQEASYRVASFLGLGILLLAAAFAYQKLRPEPPRDLREVPRALR